MACCIGGPRIGGAGLVTHSKGKTREQILEELRQAQQPIEVDGGYIIKIVGT